MTDRRFLVKHYEPTEQEKARMEHLYLCFIYDEPSIIVKATKLIENGTEGLKADIVICAGGDQIILPTAPDKAIALMKEYKDRVIIKKKYIAGNFVVFVYEDRHTGISIAKVDADKRGRIPPTPQNIILGQEITQDPTYKDSTIVRFGTPPIGPRMRSEQDIL